MEEKTKLSRQLTELQDQVRSEQEARNTQRKEIEHQQSHLNAQMTDYMGKLHIALMDIEKRHEEARRDLMKHTEDTVKRIREDAAATAESSRRKGTSRIGDLESDPEDSAVHPMRKAAIKDDDAAMWNRMEKIMETFMHAQSLKQQEIDKLVQENARLSSKASKHRTKRQAYLELPTPLMAMAALDAARFGVDYGLVSAAEKKDARDVVEKTVQTDPEDDLSAKKASQRPVAQTHVPVQVKPQPTRIPTPTVKPQRDDSRMKPVAAKVQQVQAASDMNEKKSADSAAKLARRMAVQRSARIITRAARRYLARKAAMKTVRRVITLHISAVKNVLRPHELARIQQLDGQQIEVQVTEEMTAYQLRCAIADKLSGWTTETSIRPFDVEDDNTSNSEPFPTERIVLRLKQPDNSVVNDRDHVHGVVDNLDVCILPFQDNQEEAPVQEKPVLTKSVIQGLVRLQSGVRRYLAMRRYRLMKQAASTSHKTLLQDVNPATDSKAVPVANEIMPIESCKMSPSMFSAQCESIRKRLTATASSRVASSSEIHQDSKSSPNTEDKMATTGMDLSRLESCLADLERARTKLSPDMREVVEHIGEWIDKIAKEEFGASVGTKSSEERVMERAKVRLEVLLSQLRDRGSLRENIDVSESTSTVNAPPVPSAKDTIGKQPQSESSVLENTADIRALADAYEQDNESSHEVETSAAELDKPQQQQQQQRQQFAVTAPTTVTRLRHGERLNAPISVTSSAIVRQRERSGTPTGMAEMGVANPGSPRPVTDTPVISPFSKTPLISRRTRRGAGFDNAR